ncbi:MAG: hypothetical protein ACTSYI_03895 [Promethearchaeota archaeon]
MEVTNFTFTLDQKLKKKMKSHKELNWSEIFRNAARAKIRELDNRESNIVSIHEITQELPEELLALFETEPTEKDEEEYRQLKELEKERIQKQKSIELED